MFKDLKVASTVGWSCLRGLRVRCAAIAPVGLSLCVVVDAGAAGATGPSKQAQVIVIVQHLCSLQHLHTRTFGPAGVEKVKEEC